MTPNEWFKRQLQDAIIEGWDDYDAGVADLLLSFYWTFETSLKPELSEQELATLAEFEKMSDAYSGILVEDEDDEDYEDEDYEDEDAQDYADEDEDEDDNPDKVNK